MPRLRRVVHLGRSEVLDRADVGIEEEVHPFGAWSRLEDLHRLVQQDRNLLGCERHADVHAVFARRYAVVEAEHLHGAAERADGTGVDAEILTVGALERARDEPHRGRRGHGERRVCERFDRCVGLTPQHRVVRERAVEE